MFESEKGDDWLVSQEHKPLVEQVRRQLIMGALELSTELGLTLDDIVDLMDWANASKN